MRKVGFVHLACAGAVTFALSVAVATDRAKADTVKITGGSTAVSVTADLAALGLTPGLVGLASLGDPVDGYLTALFPITGGKIKPGGATIRHEGSGLSLSDGTTTAAVGNFVVKTNKGKVKGDLLGVTTGSPVKLFKFGDGTELPGVELKITGQFSRALKDAFGTPSLKGSTFGYAVPSPETTPVVAPVPLPAGAALMAGALAMLGFVRRRRSAA